MNEEDPSRHSDSEEIRFVKDSTRLLRDTVESALWARGWVVADLKVADDQPLKWFWPPTAPVGYAGHPEWIDPGLRARPQMQTPRLTPWRVPTRIIGAGASWLLQYGEATARAPDKPISYTEDSALINDLERLEWWPMTVEEARQIQTERLFDVTTAWARDEHYVSCDVTDPYGSRFDRLNPHRRYENNQNDDSVEPPSSPRPRGNLESQWLLNEAEAWASAVRTQRAAG